MADAIVIDRQMQGWMDKCMPAEKDNRYSLHGVHVESGFAVATDGHMLVKREIDYTGAPVRLLIAKTPKLSADDHVLIDGVALLLGSECTRAFMSQKGKAIVVTVQREADSDYPFPDWREVLPKTKGYRAGFGLDLSLITKLQSAFGDKSAKVTLGQAGDDCSPIVVRLGSDPKTEAVIMPVRTDDPDIQAARRCLACDACGDDTNSVTAMSKELDELREALSLSLKEEKLLRESRDRYRNERDELCIVRDELREQMGDYEITNNTMDEITNTMMNTTGVEVPFVSPFLAEALNEIGGE